MNDIDLTQHNLKHNMNATINGVPVSTILKKAVFITNNGKQRLPLKRQLLVTLALRDGMCCTYCKRPVDFLWMGDFEVNEVATFEHLTPESQGGDISEENGEIACELCNGNRADQPIEEFLTKMADGFYVEDEVKFRRTVRKAKRKASYRVMRRERTVWLCKEAVAKVAKRVYNLFNPVLADAELG